MGNVIKPINGTATMTLTDYDALRDKLKQQDEIIKFWVSKYEQIEAEYKSIREGIFSVVKSSTRNGLVATGYDREIVELLGRKVDDLKEEE